MDATHLHYPKVLFICFIYARGWFKANFKDGGRSDPGFKSYLNAGMQNLSFLQNASL
jgi:hypothetical protein